MKKEIIACALLLTLAAGCVCNIRYQNKSYNYHRVYATFASSHLPARPFRSLRPFYTPARGLSNPCKKQSLTQSVRPRKVGSAPGGLTACYRLTAHKKINYLFGHMDLNFSAISWSQPH